MYERIEQYMPRPGNRGLQQKACVRYFRIYGNGSNVGKYICQCFFVQFSTALTCVQEPCRRDPTGATTYLAIDHAPPKSNKRKKNICDADGTGCTSIPGQTRAQELDLTYHTQDKRATYLQCAANSVYEPVGQLLGKLIEWRYTCCTAL